MLDSKFDTFNHWTDGGGRASAGHMIAIVSPSVTSSLCIDLSGTTGGTGNIKIYSKTNKNCVH